MELAAKLTLELAPPEFTAKGTMQFEKDVAACQARNPSRVASSQPEIWALASGDEQARTQELVFRHRRPSSSTEERKSRPARIATRSVAGGLTITDDDYGGRWRRHAPGSGLPPTGRAQGARGGYGSAGWAMRRVR
jgi:hypothetical protein